MHPTPTKKTTRNVACGPDLVPGNPPIPISVWRTPAAYTDPNPMLPTSLLTQLAEEFSRPGQRLVDLTGGLLDSCAPGRTVHAGGFSDGDITIAGGSPNPGCVALIAAAWPPSNTRRDQRSETAATLVAAARRWLIPGGVLVLLAGNPPSQPPTDYGPFVTVAAAAGLGYLQHIAAVRTPVEGSVITAPDSPPENTFGGALEATVVHLRVHADVLVFATRGGGGRG